MWTPLFKTFVQWVIGCLLTLLILVPLVVFWSVLSLLPDVVALAALCAIGGAIFVYVVQD
jgi:hypothetical protein